MKTGVATSVPVPVAGRGVVPPALQPAYMTRQLMPHQKSNLHPPLGQERNRYLTYEGGMVHDVDKAIKYLRDEVVGFFVSVPLQWGHKEDVNNPGKAIFGVDIG